MTFQSLSSLTLGPGASSAAKTQENAAVRPERTGQSGLDFSAYLSQAMQSKEWAGSSHLQRQGLADLSPQALDRSAQAPQPPDTRNTEPRETAQRDASDARSSREDTRSATTKAGGTHQELTQRALRNASLRAAQSRAESGTAARAGNSEVKARKAAARHDDETHATTATNTPTGVLPAAGHQTSHDVADAQDAHNVHTPARVAGPTGAVAGDALAQAAATSPLDATTAQTTGAVAAQAPASAGLTTVQLGSTMQIITPGEGVVNEQSLQAFAQSMGIDATLFKQLSSSIPTGSMDASGLRAGVTATDALTGTPLLQTMPTDMSAIDVSQAIPAGLILEDLHMDWLGGRRSLEFSTPSTLDILGMREGGTGAEGITALQASSDAGAQGHASDSNPGLGQSNLGAQARAGGTASAQGTHAPAPQNMAEHFEKLSAKLATEMAGRIHEQFSQGEWKMKFALKPASLGQVDIQLEMRDGKLAAVLQADNPMTQDLLQNGSQRLRDALSQMGLSQSSVTVGDGRSQAFQGDRQSGGHGSGMASAHPSDSPDDAVTTVANAPRRNSLSQLDFYA